MTRYASHTAAMDSGDDDRQRQQERQDWRVDPSVPSPRSNGYEQPYRPTSNDLGRTLGLLPNRGGGQPWAPQPEPQPWGYSQPQAPVPAPLRVPAPPVGSGWGDPNPAAALPEGGHVAPPFYGYVPPAPPRPPVVGGVGGGVGTSLFAELLHGVDDGVWTPRTTGDAHPVDVLVCRSTAASAAGAYRIVGEHLQPAACKPVLVVVSDGLRGLPHDARARLTLLQSACTAIVRVPYVATWRDVERPDLNELQPPIGSAVTAIRVALGLPTEATQTAPRRRRRANRKEHS